MKNNLTDFFKKKDVTILVTDSGLGGLSITADLAAKLPQSGVFENSRIVFFNSLFHNQSGYNIITSEDEKVKFFNNALEAMEKKYHPDLLLIACNTLSVLYDKTPFSKQAPFAVMGIVETGVDLIAKQLDKNPDAVAIIFATQTTIDSNYHKNRLISSGYSENRIIGQACPLLVENIERDYHDDTTILMITKYVSQALDKIDAPDIPIFASLNCTHYGYSMQQFKDIFAEAGYPEIEIINPNPEMSSLILKPQYLHRYSKTTVTLEIVSKTRINEKNIKSLGMLLQMISLQTFEALKNYHYDPNLFDAEFG